MADFSALEADEIEAVDAFIDFLPVEHPPSELIDADAEEIFVIFFDLAPARPICLVEVLIILGKEL